MDTAAVLSLALRLAGVSLVVLSFLHLVFPKRFRWREELAALSLLNREIFMCTLFLSASC